MGFDMNCYEVLFCNHVLKFPYESTSTVLDMDKVCKR